MTFWEGMILKMIKGGKRTTECPQSRALMPNTILRDIKRLIEGDLSVALLKKCQNAAVNFACSF